MEARMVAGGPDSAPSHASTNDALSRLLLRGWQARLNVGAPVGNSPIGEDLGVDVGVEIQGQLWQGTAALGPDVVQIQLERPLGELTQPQHALMLTTLGLLAIAPTRIADDVAHVGFDPRGGLLIARARTRDEGSKELDALDALADALESVLLRLEKGLALGMASLNGGGDPAGPSSPESSSRTATPAA
jgi:hypothetical protein